VPEMFIVDNTEHPHMLIYQNARSRHAPNIRLGVLVTFRMPVGSSPVVSTPLEKLRKDG